MTEADVNEASLYVALIYLAGSSLAIYAIVQGLKWIYRSIAK